MDGFQSIREKKKEVFFVVWMLPLFFVCFFLRNVDVFVASCPTCFMTQVCGDSIELEL